MAYLYRLIFTILFSLFAAGAAAGVPEIDGWYIVPDSGGAELGPFGGASQACDAWYATYDEAQKKLGRTTTFKGFDGRWCSANNSSGGSSSRMPTKRGKTCPAHSTGANGACNCDSGFIEDGGQCIPKPSTKPPICNTDPTDGVCDFDSADKQCEAHAAQYNTITMGNKREGRVTGRAPLEEEITVCMDFGQKRNGQPQGCKANFTGTYAVGVDGGGTYTYGHQWAVTHSTNGYACALGVEGPSNDPEKPQEVKPNPPCKGYPGSVNGVDVCIAGPSVNSSGVDWTRIRDANGNSTDVKRQVDCKGEICKITETTKKPDGSTSTTTTDGVSRNNFCAQNPTSSVCKGPTDSSGNSKGNGSGSGSGSTTGGGTGNGNGNGDGDDDGSSFGGSCSSGWTCDGDAIQCAIAKEQHKRSCELFDTDNDEYKAYVKERLGESKKITGDLKGNHEVDLSKIVSAADQFLGGSSGSCPPDRSVSVMGHQFVLSFSVICPYLALLGHGLVIAASISAALILFRRAS